MIKIGFNFVCILVLPIPTMCKNFKSLYVKIETILLPAKVFLKKQEKKYQCKINTFRVTFRI